jgi:Tfp pilus assembly PilM family ATPase
LAKFLVRHGSRYIGVSIMARRADSVIGIDLGKHSFKGVVVRRKGDATFVLTGFASREVPEEFASPEELAHELKALMKDLGHGAKACAAAISDPAALLRIIEQPDTPVELLRNALRLNGLAVLNQECKDFVLDIAPVVCAGAGESPNARRASSSGTEAGVLTKTKYLVGGMLRPTVKQISAAMAKTRTTLDILQLAPVCSFNAFEFAYPEVFANEAFVLLDLGHSHSTVLIGSKSELVLVRPIDYGGKALTQALTAEGSLDVGSAWHMIQQGDETMTEICRQSLGRLSTEVRNSIGFFEGQREEGINRIFVSGGLAKVETVLQTLSDELGLACEIWDPLETCELSLPAPKRQSLPNEFVSLNVACGAAFEYLRN